VANWNATGIPTSVKPDGSVKVGPPLMPNGKVKRTMAFTEK
jgi:hypothetical protein